ncbi:hypothetical protein TanjilG_02261 [Lupinus angustifolius]|uniref:Uncharacterized protein n=1 Tax=Lupinus angustifolius TaxID=3871 RepID=A0A4P1QQQ5_LUPAN|nr:hypothetical protein TanjilG_02261 [Lupinus angustifolius]
MDHLSNQQETHGIAYPQASYVTAPPTVGYPTKNDDPVGYPKESVPHQTIFSNRVKGGLWKGW